MDGDLYTLRYKAGNRGVLTGWIRATSLQLAVKVGQEYCNRHINHTFISVERTVIADESILEAPSPNDDHPDMIDDSEMPMKTQRSIERETRPEPPPAADPAVIAQRNREMEQEDEREDAEEAAREAAEDAKLKGRRADADPNDPPAAKPAKLPSMKKSTKK